MKLHGSLLFSNLITLVMAIVFRWELSEMVWIYFFQSLLIGVFAMIRLAIGFAPHHKQEKVENMSGMALHLVLPIFFCVHFGFFHLIFAAFFLGNITIGDPTPILLGCAAFFLEQIYYLVSDVRAARIVGRIEDFFRPYVRIFPISLFIILGVRAGAGDVSIFAMSAFIIVKTLAEVYFNTKLSRHQTVIA